MAAARLALLAAVLVAAAGAAPGARALDACGACQLVVRGLLEGKVSTGDVCPFPAPQYDEKAACMSQLALVRRAAEERPSLLKHELNCAAPNGGAGAGCPAAARCGYLKSCPAPGAGYVASLDDARLDGTVSAVTGEKLDADACEACAGAFENMMRGLLAEDRVCPVSLGGHPRQLCLEARAAALLRDGAKLRDPTLECGGAGRRCSAKARCSLLAKPLCERPEGVRADLAEAKTEAERRADADAAARKAYHVPLALGCDTCVAFLGRNAGRGRSSIVEADECAALVRPAGAKHTAEERALLEFCRGVSKKLVSLSDVHVSLFTKENLLCADPHAESPSLLRPNVDTVCPYRERCAMRELGYCRHDIHYTSSIDGAAARTVSRAMELRQ